MKRLDPDAFSLRWYHDMVYGTKNPWGLAAKNSFIIAIFATLGSVLLGMLNWIEDSGYIEKAQKFGDFFTKHLNKILIGLAALAA